MISITSPSHRDSKISQIRKNNYQKQVYHKIETERMLKTSLQLSHFNKKFYPKLGITRVTTSTEAGCTEADKSWDVTSHTNAFTRPSSYSLCACHHEHQLHLPLNVML
jgi:hypothetical protein